MAKKTAKSPPFAKLLRELCERRWPGSTLREQAEKLGITASTLSRFYSLNISPAPETVYRLAQVLCADPEFLFAALDGREVTAEDALFPNEWWSLGMSNYRSSASKLLICYVCEILFDNFMPDLYHPFFAFIGLTLDVPHLSNKVSKLRIAKDDFSSRILGTHREALVRSAIVDDLTHRLSFLANTEATESNGKGREVTTDRSNWERCIDDEAILRAADYVNLIEVMYTSRAFVHACLYHVSPRRYLEAVPPHIWLPFVYPFDHHQIAVCVDVELKRIEKRLLPFASSELERLYPKWESKVEKIIFWLEKNEC